MNKIKQWVDEFNEFNYTYKLLTFTVLSYLALGTVLMVNSLWLSAIVFYVSALCISMVMKTNAKSNSRE